MTVAVSITTDTRGDIEILVNGEFVGGTDYGEWQPESGEPTGPPVDHPSDDDLEKTIYVSEDYTVTNSVLNHVLRLKGGSPITLTFAVGVTGQFSIIHQGGANLKVNIRMLGGEKMNGQSSWDDILSFDKGLYLNKVSDASWHVVGLER